MNKISKKKLERIAVDAVTAEANKPASLLAANIPVGDKGISFDGDIEVFNDDSESVDSLLGKVPVQVKGKQVREFTNGTRTYPMGLDHLKNYYDSQGVILFVVEIKENGDTKVFYKQLLPAELRHIIKIYGEQRNQSQRNIELRALSETTLENVCRKFLTESKKQPSVLIENNPFKKGDFNSYRITSLTYNPVREETSNIFDHDFTIYGVKETLNVPLTQGRIRSYSSTILEKVISNGNEYDFVIKVTEEHNRTNMLIEDSLEITYSPVEGKFKFNVNKFRSLETQLKIIPFILDFLTGNSIQFMRLSITLGDLNIQNKDNIIKEFNELYLIFKELKKIFKTLNVPYDKEIETANSLNATFDQIKSFVMMFKEDDFSNFVVENPEQVKFTHLKIGDLQLAFFYNPNSSTKLINAFSEEILKNDIRIGSEENKYPHSPYIMLPEHVLANAANVDLSIIKKSFDSFNPFYNKQVANVTNNFCLTCIKAYDISKNIGFLELADYIYGFYNGENFNKSIILINQYQINLRKNGKLSSSEMEELINLKLGDLENIELQFCISVLLENKHEIKIFFKQLGEDIQEYYLDLPIYELAKKFLN